MGVSTTFLTNSRTTSSWLYAGVAFILMTAPSVVMNCATHNGTRTDCWPLVVAVETIFLAVPPVTQPPHVNPTIARAIAPPTAPQQAGFTAALVSLEISMNFTLRFEEKRIFTHLYLTLLARSVVV